MCSSRRGNLTQHGKLVPDTTRTRPTLGIFHYQSCIITRSLLSEQIFYKAENENTWVFMSVFFSRSWCVRLVQLSLSS